MQIKAEFLDSKESGPRQSLRRERRRGVVQEDRSCGDGRQEAGKRPATRRRARILLEARRKARASASNHQGENVVTDTFSNPFRPALFDFLRDLEANNTREWFAENKGRYEDHVKEPSLRFISDFGPPLREISPHFQAIPKGVGGSLFRIHRDTRFSKDKTPYKTHVGLHFRHSRAKDAHAPGFYLHLATSGSFIGLGIWHPDGPALRSIRSAIAENPSGWRQARDDEAFAATFELAGDSLKRPPRDYSPDHPLVEDLKRKDFIGVANVTRKEALASDFPRRFAEACARGAPLVRFLCKALDVPY
jgi:uncharacterized protein (TIGR02453 family)